MLEVRAVERDFVGGSALFVRLSDPVEHGARLDLQSAGISIVHRLQRRVVLVAVPCVGLIVSGANRGCDGSGETGLTWGLTLRTDFGLKFGLFPPLVQP